MGRRRSLRDVEERRWNKEEPAGAGHCAGYGNGI
jgi:hypothetical protein